MIISSLKAQEAAEVLEVQLDGLTLNALGKAYRKKAKTCHPDHHGNSKLGLWARVDWAKGCLTHWLEQHPEPAPAGELSDKGDCRACGGEGRIKVGKGRFGSPLTMMCQMCRGEGTVTPLENDSDV